MSSEMAERTTKRIVGTIIKVLIFVPIAVFVFGEIVLRLWNWLMPTLFHLPLLSFWQALGLLVLSWILFGGLRGSGRGCGGRGRNLGGRWEQMTPEEREKFREWMRSRGGNVGTEASPKP